MVAPPPSLSLHAYEWLAVHTFVAVFASAHLRATAFSQRRFGLPKEAKVERMLERWTLAGGAVRASVFLANVLPSLFSRLVGTHWIHPDWWSFSVVAALAGWAHFSSTQRVHGGLAMATVAALVRLATDENVKAWDAALALAPTLAMADAMVWSRPGTSPPRAFYANPWVPLQLVTLCASHAASVSGFALGVMVACCAVVPAMGRLRLASALE